MIYFYEMHMASQGLGNGAFEATYVLFKSWMSTPEQKKKEKILNKSNNLQ